MCGADAARSAHLLLDDGHVGDRGAVLGHDERDVEAGLDGGLIPAGEGAAGVDRLELSDGHVAVLAVHAVLAAVEAGGAVRRACSVCTDEGLRTP